MCLKNILLLYVQFEILILTCDLHLSVNIVMMNCQIFVFAQLIIFPFVPWPFLELPRCQSVTFSLLCFAFVLSPLAMLETKGSGFSISLFIGVDMFVCAGNSFNVVPVLYNIVKKNQINDKTRHRLEI